MKLPFLDKEKKETPKVAVSVQNDLIYGCLFQVEANEIAILALHEENYEEEALLEKLITTLRRLSQNAHGDAPDVIFGLPEEFIEGEKVKEPYEGKLQEAANTLHLSPIAFVSNPKAIAFFLEKEEGGKPSALAVALGKKNHSIFLFEDGALKTSRKTLGSGVEDTAGTIRQLGPNLPPRIILIGTLPSESFREELSASLSSPAEDSQSSAKVTTLPRDTYCLAVALATAYDLGYLTIPQIEAAGEFLEGSPPVKKEESELEHFGFVHDRDVLGSDEIAETRQEEPVVTEEKSQPKFSLPNFSLVFAQLPFTIFTGKKNLVVFATLIVVFVIATFSAWWFLSSSQITLKVKSQVLEKEEEVLVTGESNDNLVGAQVETTLSGSQKAVTTGKKEVGEKARGEVTVFNKTSQLKTFASGTVFKSTSGVIFTLDSQVAVASRSATLEGITYGKAKASLTAREIGPDGNISTGANLTISDFDQNLYSANNDQSFAGGSKRDVSVVSEEDRKRLQEALVKELLAKATEELKGKVTAGAKLEEAAIQAEAKSTKFDKDVGQEATVLSLSSEVLFSAVSYNQEDLFKFLSEKTKGDIPSGYQVLADFSTVEVYETLPRDDGVLLKTKFKGALIPEFNLDQITKDLVGKNAKAAKDYLLTLQDVQGAHITVLPQLPGFLSRMPHAAGRISIRIEPEKPL